MVVKVFIEASILGEVPDTKFRAIKQTIIGLKFDPEQQVEQLLITELAKLSIEEFKATEEEFQFVKAISNSSIRVNIAIGFVLN